MHSVFAEAPDTRAQPEPYAVSAEFYDILQAHDDDRHVRRLYGAAVAQARMGIVDVGAGTGRVTLMSLARSKVGVHAVEPARAMRAALMTRLAALPAPQRARVSVHPSTLDEAALRDVADLVICHNTVACLTPDARETLWTSVAEVLVPGGRLLLQLPPDRLPAEEQRRVFPVQRMGRHEYGGHMVMSAAGPRIRTRVDYWARGTHGLDGMRGTHGTNGLLGEHTETFWMWPATRSDLVADLRRHGFALSSARHDPAVLAVTLGQRPGQEPWRCHTDGRHTVC
ncbi:class I SAM-dependent methyltransferase [Streptomyces sp. BH-SS-21]|uniref:Class I SAM-dependent methyltransferase n=1 Tax=Streptomyces liliiviolaceus TaxID=2823109 RepID=A0A941B9T9_9ACTN|nr:class I SAM-dependent methyltransferase [Streptomyces liliiviolaceus]MBQ0850423.1 class I SAM-dependent methyltransferase [Streptomyces liliiviolaceus]